MKLFYPLRCPFCDEILGPYEQKRMVCKTCDEKLVYIKDDYCLKCGKPLESESAEYCMDCAKRKHYFDQARSLLSYQGNVKHSLYRFKNANRREYALFYGAEIEKRFRRWIERNRIDYIAAVPMYSKRRRERGYNQSEVLAAELGFRVGIKVKKKLLVKKADTKPQKTLGRAERRENLKNAFIVTETLKGKKILLVDDIYTTGATVDMAAKALKEAGADRVYAICVGAGG